MLKRITSSLILFCFLLNSTITDLAFGQSLNYYQNSDKLAVSSRLDDISGIELKDMGRIKFALLGELIKISKENPKGADLWQALIKKGTVNTKERTVFRPADMVFFFQDARPITTGMLVKCVLRDHKYSGTRTYYALFSMQEDEAGGFPISVHTEQEYKDSGEFLGTHTPKNAKTIDRYIENEHAIDAFIAKQIAAGQFAEIEGYAQSIGWDKKYPDVIRPGKNNYLPAFILEKIEQEIDDFLGGLTTVKKALEGKNIVFINVPQGQQPVIKSPEGKEVTVWSHTSENTVYIFLPARIYSMSEFLVKKPGMSGASMSISAESEIRASIKYKLLHEIGVIYGLPFSYNDTPADGWNTAKIVNQLDRAFDQCNTASSIIFGNLKVPELLDRLPDLNMLKEKKMLKQTSQPASGVTSITTVLDELKAKPDMKDWVEYLINDPDGSVHLAGIIGYLKAEKLAQLEGFMKLLGERLSAVETNTQDTKLRAEFDRLKAGYRSVLFRPSGERDTDSTRLGKIVQALAAGDFDKDMLKAVSHILTKMPVGANIAILYSTELAVKTLTAAIKDADGADVLKISFIVTKDPGGTEYRIKFDYKDGEANPKGNGSVRKPELLDKFASSRLVAMKDDKRWPTVEGAAAKTAAKAPAETEQPAAEGRAVAEEPVAADPVAEKPATAPVTPAAPIVASSEIKNTVIPVDPAIVVATAEGPINTEPAPAVPAAVAKVAGKPSDSGEIELVDDNVPAQPGATQTAGMVNFDTGAKLPLPQQVFGGTTLKGEADKNLHKIKLPSGVTQLKAAGRFVGIRTGDNKLGVFSAEINAYIEFNMPDGKEPKKLKTLKGITDFIITPDFIVLTQANGKIIAYDFNKGKFIKAPEGTKDTASPRYSLIVGTDETTILDSKDGKMIRGLPLDSIILPEGVRIESFDEISKVLTLYIPEIKVQSKKETPKGTVSHDLYSIELPADISDVKLAGDRIFTVNLKGELRAFNVLTGAGVEFNKGGKKLQALPGIADFIPTPTLVILKDFNGRAIAYDFSKNGFVKAPEGAGDSASPGYILVSKEKGRSLVKDAKTGDFVEGLKLNALVLPEGVKIVSFDAKTRKLTLSIPGLKTQSKKTEKAAPVKPALKTEEFEDFPLGLALSDTNIPEQAEDPDDIINALIAEELKPNRQADIAKIEEPESSGSTTGSIGIVDDDQPQPAGGGQDFGTVLKVLSGKPMEEWVKFIINNEVGSEYLPGLVDYFKRSTGPLLILEKFMKLLESSLEDKAVNPKDPRLKEEFGKAYTGFIRYSITEIAIHFGMALEALENISKTDEEKAVLSDALKDIFNQMTAMRKEAVSANEEKALNAGKITPGSIFMLTGADTYTESFLICLKKNSFIEIKYRLLEAGRCSINALNIKEPTVESLSAYFKARDGSRVTLIRPALNGLGDLKSLLQRSSMALIAKTAEFRTDKAYLKGLYDQLAAMQYRELESGKDGRVIFPGDILRIGPAESPRFIMCAEKGKYIVVAGGDIQSRINTSSASIKGLMAHFPGLKLEDFKLIADGSEAEDIEMLSSLAQYIAGDYIYNMSAQDESEVQAVMKTSDTTGAKDITREMGMVIEEMDTIPNNLGSPEFSKLKEAVFAALMNSDQAKPSLNREVSVGDIIHAGTKSENASTEFAFSGHVFLIYVEKGSFIEIKFKGESGKMISVDKISIKNSSKFGDLRHGYFKDHDMLLCAPKIDVIKGLLEQARQLSAKAAEDTSAEDVSAAVSPATGEVRLEVPSALEVGDISGNTAMIAVMKALASEAGKDIPVFDDTRYNLLVTEQFFTNGELADHQQKYGSRFDLNMVSGRDANQFIDNVLAKAKDKEARTVALVPNDLPMDQIEKLTTANIRFIMVNANELADMRASKDADREKFQLDTYAIMLLVRRIDSTITADSSIYRALSFFMKTHFAFTEDDITVTDYINAIVNGQFAKMIKAYLAYRPSKPYDAETEYKGIAAALLSA